MWNEFRGVPETRNLTLLIYFEKLMYAALNFVVFFFFFNLSAMVCVHLKLERFLFRMYAVFILTVFNDFVVNSGLHITTITPVGKLNVAAFSAVWNAQV